MGLLKDTKLLLGVEKSLELITKKNFIFVITNQSGIGRGYYKVSDMRKIHLFLNKIFKKKFGN